VKSDNLQKLTDDADISSRLLVTTKADACECCCVFVASVDAQHDTLAAAHIRCEAEKR